MSAHPVSRRAVLGAALGAVTAAAAGCDQPPEVITGDSRGTGPMLVGVLTDRSGRLKGEGIRYENGLRTGLLWSTNRSNQVGVRPIESVWLDDKADPATAAAAAEQLLAQGCRIIVGGSTSPVALRVAEIATRHKAIFIAGVPTADALTGLSRYTFRSGHQDHQDLLAARSRIEPGRRTVVLTTGNPAAAVSVLRATPVVAPVTADVASVVARVKAARPEALYVSWPLPAPALWAALDRAGLLTRIAVVTALGPRYTWRGYGPDGDSLRLVSSYMDGASTNNAYTTLRGAAPGRRTDTGHVEGFTAAMMIVRALQFGPDDVDRMVGTLETYRPGGVKGDMYVRAEDHALIQPMYLAKLTWTGAAGALTAVRTGDLSLADTAPPVVAMRS
jgi:branched-chain amino acid transport system substrate-binding protein